MKDIIAATTDVPSLGRELTIPMTLSRFSSDTNRMFSMTRFRSFTKSLECFNGLGSAFCRSCSSIFVPCPSEIFDIREEEVKTGKLKMPTQPTTLHILSGPDGKFNSETNEVEDAYYRYVVYVPYATSESTGLPSKPMQPGFPWLMDPGTHRAHIMITPPRPK